MEENWFAADKVKNVNKEGVRRSVAGEKKVLALIPARGGSKGIREKNIVNLNGRPLVAYTIEAARQSRCVCRVVVSTDSRAIAEIAMSEETEPSDVTGEPRSDAQSRCSNDSRSTSHA